MYCLPLFFCTTACSNLPSSNRKIPQLKILPSFYLHLIEKPLLPGLSVVGKTTFPQHCKQINVRFYILIRCVYSHFLYVFLIFCLPRPPSAVRATLPGYSQRISHWVASSSRGEREKCGMDQVAHPNNRGNAGENEEHREVPLFYHLCSIRPRCSWLLYTVTPPSVYSPLPLDWIHSPTCTDPHHLFKTRLWGIDCSASSV